MAVVTQGYKGRFGGKPYLFFRSAGTSEESLDMLKPASLGPLL